MSAKSFIFIIVSILLFSFSYGKENESKNEPQLQEKQLTVEEFIAVYVDLSVAAEQFLDDTLTLTVAQDSIFSKHNITRQSFEDFRKKVDENPEKWAYIWQDIIKRLEELDRGEQPDVKVETKKEEKKSKKD
jgi:hypothetical protein